MDAHGVNHRGLTVRQRREGRVAGEVEGTRCRVNILGRRVCSSQEIGDRGCHNLVAIGAKPSFVCASQPAADHLSRQ